MREEKRERGSGTGGSRSPPPNRGNAAREGRQREVIGPNRGRRIGTVVVEAPTAGRLTDRRTRSARFLRTVTSQRVHPALVSTVQPDRNRPVQINLSVFRCSLPRTPRPVRCPRLISGTGSGTAAPAADRPLFAGPSSIAFGPNHFPPMSPSPPFDGPVDTDAMDADDWRLLRAVRDDPHEWAARANVAASPIDELRLYELARAGYVKHVGERFLWRLTPKGRVALAYRTDTTDRDRADASLLHLEPVQGDGSPAHAHPPFAEHVSLPPLQEESSERRGRLWPGSRAPDQEDR